MLNKSPGIGYEQQERFLIRNNEGLVIGLYFNNNEIFSIPNIFKDFIITQMSDLTFWNNQDAFHFIGYNNDDEWMILKYNLDIWDNIRTDNILNYSHQIPFNNINYGKYSYDYMNNIIENKIRKVDKRIHDVKINILSDEMYIDYNFKIILDKEKPNSYDAFKTYESIINNLKLDLINVIYEENILSELSEMQFITNVLLPLFRKIGYLNIKHSHGVREFGKDITFNSKNELGITRNYGVQVKTGNISSKHKSKIDEIIMQVDDAFSIPYLDLYDKNEKYITDLLIITTGKFTNNAEEKILHKNRNKNVYFYDGEKILELIKKYSN